MRLAQEEARGLGHNCVGTEHLLLGLLRVSDGAAARALELLDITIERARPLVARLVGTTAEPFPGQVPFTPRAKKVLVAALHEALSLGHNHIGTEHVLLGIVRENEGVPARVLLECGADDEAVREQVVRLPSGPGRRDVQAGGFKLDFEDVRVSPVAGLRTLFLSAAAQALDDGRIEVEIEDFLIALVRDPTGARLLAELGVDEAAIRKVIAPRRESTERSEGVAEA